MQQRNQQGLNVKLLLSPVELAQAGALIDSVSTYLNDNNGSFASDRLKTYTPETLIYVLRRWSGN
jgi:hypothetical protein